MSHLKNVSLANPTSLQFGPDGKLYIAQQDGQIKIVTIQRNGPNNYTAISTETLTLVRDIPNHNDDGTPYPAKKRQVTGLLVDGNPSNPIIYITSSDPRIGAGSFGDVNLCTNSGVISKLFKENGKWTKIDLVRGLPRSEENHATNGLVKHGNRLLVCQGGGTNAGAPSALWTYITEYALGAAILVIDLTAIEDMPTKIDPTEKNPYKYDIPTLDDPTRPNNSDGSDINDPWGGNDGLNQAKIIPGGPVQIYAGGFRNPYDIVITKHPSRSGRVYSIDNGPNRNWGGYPVKENGTVTNNYPEGEPGSLTVNNFDGMEYIGNINTYKPGDFYAGHPTPIRANPSGAGLFTHDSIHGSKWRINKSDLPVDWPPVPESMKDPREADYYNAGTTEDKSLIYFEQSTNGMCEYLYSGNGMYGDILAVGYEGDIFRIKMTDDPIAVRNKQMPNRVNMEKGWSIGDAKPLDITAQADGEIFEGTIWIASWGKSRIDIFEPGAEIECNSGPNSPNDDDEDGYSNDEETKSGTDPCNGADKPTDFDGDLIGDFLDDDDDNDGIKDIVDLYVRDRDNGASTTIPTHYALFNYDPGTGFFGLGFTGLMSNYKTDYLNMYDPYNMVAGGAAGALTLEAVTPGDAFEDINTQMNAFQFGINVDKFSGTYMVSAAILPSYFNATTPKDDQSQGIYIGNGDQDNYIKLVINSNGGKGGIALVTEVNGKATIVQNELPSSTIPTGPIIFKFYIDPENAVVYPMYEIAKSSYSFAPITTSGRTRGAIQKSDTTLAVGIISTSRNANETFNATWDYIEVKPAIISSINWNNSSSPSNIIAYPNPTRDIINISFKDKIEQNYAIKIYNSMSKSMRETIINSDSKGKDLSVNVSDLEPGLYFMQLISKDSKTATLKFIKH
ncbi:Kelch repeat-containing protein [Sporocytophaga myxococcoides]|uniref:Kelch repeat-containing protein n=2 Tax=Sporocytophaga myxococcoides TaxID=153721 RepID=A0A098LFP6_9BACT|nr:Kelch repeat-containing protein [Sporocytophaga myxococcoides]